MEIPVPKKKEKEEKEKEKIVEQEIADKLNMFVLKYQKAFDIAKKQIPNASFEEIGKLVEKILEKNED